MNPIRSNRIRKMSFERTKMRTLLQKPHVKSMIHGGDKLFSIVSLLSLPLLISLCVYWHYEREPLHDLESPVEMVVSPGETTHLASFYTVSFDANRALYSMWIEDSRGRMVYEYQPQWVSKSSFTFGNQNIVVPLQLAPGKYRLRGELQYPLNPFKTATVSAELVHLDVVKK